MKIILADIVLLVAGAGLAVGAGVPFIGEIQKMDDETTSSIGVFAVTWATRTENLPAQSDTDFQSSDLTFAVRSQNITKGTVVVACTDPAGTAAPFTLRVSVTAPNGTTKSQNVPCAGTQRIDVPIQEVPTTDRVNGTTESEARENLPPSLKARGDWRVQITGSRGGLETLPAGRPGGNVALEITTWTAALEPENPTIPK